MAPGVNTLHLLFHVVSLHSLIKISGEKMWQVKWWFLDYNKWGHLDLQLTKWISASAYDGVIQNQLFENKFVNYLSVLHNVSALDLESKKGNPIDTNLNRFPTIFTSKWMITFIHITFILHPKWMISLAIPDDDLKVTVLEFWLRCFSNWFCVRCFL